MVGFRGAWRGRVGTPHHAPLPPWTRGVDMERNGAGVRVHEVPEGHPRLGLAGELTLLL